MSERKKVGNKSPKKKIYDNSDAFVYAENSGWREEEKWLIWFGWSEWEKSEQNEWNHLKWLNWIEMKRTFPTIYMTSVRNWVDNDESGGPLVANNDEDDSITMLVNAVQRLSECVISVWLIYQAIWLFILSALRLRSFSLSLSLFSFVLVSLYHFRILNRKWREFDGLLLVINQIVHSNHSQFNSDYCWLLLLKWPKIDTLSQIDFEWKIGWTKKVILIESALI